MILLLPYLILHIFFAFRRRLNLETLPLIIDWLLLFQTCLAITHCSTYLNDDLEAPMFKKSAAFLFKYQAVTSEVESKVRVFSPFPKIPEVNLTGAEDMLPTAIAGTSHNCFWQYVRHPKWQWLRNREDKRNLGSIDPAAGKKNQ